MEETKMDRRKVGRGIWSTIRDTLTQKREIGQKRITGHLFCVSDILLSRIFVAKYDARLYSSAALLFRKGRVAIKWTAL